MWIATAWMAAALAGSLLPAAAARAPAQRAQAQGAGAWVRLAPPAAAAGELFGSAVAVDGATALIGAPGALGDSGAAYVFERDAQGGWALAAQLTAPTALPDAELGSLVALAGQTALLATSSSAGAAQVEVFVRGPEGWSARGALPLPASEHVQSIALSGNTAAIGVRDSVYVYTADAAGRWQRAALLRPDPAESGAGEFGNAVSLSAGWLAVGAPGSAGYEGAVYLFAVDPSGRWQRRARVVADAPAFALFGWSVALSGERLLVGAYGEEDFAGAAYLFERSAGSAWSEVARLESPGERDAYECFGLSVALTPQLALIGRPCVAPDAPSAASVAAYAFQPGRDDSWSTVYVLRPPAGAAVENFASALFASGAQLVVGSPEEGVAGAAYLASGVSGAGCQFPCSPGRSRSGR